MSECAPKIIHMPGTRLSPEVVLHRTLEKIEHIESVAVVIRWKVDDTYDVDWSQQKTSELCMSAMMLHDMALKVASGRQPDAVTIHDPGTAS